jgi:hypothetical protein
VRDRFSCLSGTNVFTLDADGRIDAVTGFWRHA